MSFSTMSFPKIGPYTQYNDPQPEPPLQGYSVNNRTQLLQALIVIQQRLGWIPARLRCDLSALTGVCEEEILGLIDFYYFLDSEPATGWKIHLSTNITDMMLGQQANIDQFTQYAEQHPGLLTVKTTSCTGLCDQGPAILVNGFAMGKVTPARLKAILHCLENNTPLAKWPQSWFVMDNNTHRPGPLLKHSIQPGTVIDKVLRLSPNRFLKQLGTSGLKGRGGAGFDTAAKWTACANAVAADKVVICNADEGEPGTFKDRVLLDQHIENVLEGMTICAKVIGANHGYIYLRGEYLFLVEVIEGAISKRRQRNLLGQEFDIHLVLGAGAYICGEESALLESMEGKRGIPRIRPPFPVSHGYLGKPTVINNVETFCNITLIADKGVEAFRAFGTADVPGTKIHSISGDCLKPGIYEFPIGTSIREILASCGGENARLVQVGGAAGQLISSKDFDTPIDFQQLSSAGALMVFDAGRKPAEILNNFTHFFAHETCGFCTPCRAGTTALNQYSNRLREGNLRGQEVSALLNTCELMLASSHCGLGKAAGQIAKQTFNDYLYPREPTQSAAKVRAT